MHIDRPALPRSKSPNANESFPIWERRKKSISLLLDIIPVLHRAHDGNIHISQKTLKTSAALVHTTNLSISHLCPSVRLISHRPSLWSSFSHQPSFSLCSVEVIFHRDELAKAVNTLLLSLWTQSDPATSVSLMPLPRSLIPRPL